MNSKNKAWSEKLISRLDREFKHRWVIYDELLLSFLSKEKVWIDIGCGNNVSVADRGSAAKLSLGIDCLMPNIEMKDLFVVGSIGALPIKAESADLVTLRFVVEHLKNVEEDFAEVSRILKPGGHLIVMTTNTWSPFILLPRILPYRLKNRLLRVLYKAKESDIFPTYHRFNSVRKMKILGGSFRLDKYLYVQDVNDVRKWIFIVFFFWHLFTKPKLLQVFRTNIFAIFVKE